MQKNRPQPAGRNGRRAAQHAAPGSARASDAAVDFDANGQNEQKQSPEMDALQLLLRQLSELGEYFSYYLVAKADSAKLDLRNAIFSMALAALAFVVVASVSIAAIWFVLDGVSEGLSVLFGNRPWAGSLLTGLLLAAGLGGGMCGIVIRLKKTARERTVGKYENRQSRQQLQYGHNVAERAAANGTGANGTERK